MKSEKPLDNIDESVEESTVDYIEQVYFELPKKAKKAKFPSKHTFSSQTYDRGEAFTFVDLFAGAGGFSEGFLQAEVGNKFYEFIAANDINENCELTHVVRYNHQLGIDAKFLCQDITEPDFLDNLLEKIGDRGIDVVCGGPPCQSFSLAGKRRKFDKKDDLFSHYLNVIKELQPKYFVMENVKGILTKEKGKIKERVLEEINSIVDVDEIPELMFFIKKSGAFDKQSEFLIEGLIKRLDIEHCHKTEKEERKESFVKFVEAKFRILSPKIFDYRTSKTDENVSTIRHGFNVLIRSKAWQKLSRDIIKEKDFCNIDNDLFVDSFSQFLTDISTSEVIQKIEMAFSHLKITEAYREDCDDILTLLKIYAYSFDEILSYIRVICEEQHKEKLNHIIENLRLYKIEKPFIANASNYGVPQNRERVLFIGCRKDQKFISGIPPTVSEDEKVSIFEALYDLDFIGNNQEAKNYNVSGSFKYDNKLFKELKPLIKKRAVDGKPSIKNGKTFVEWSRQGRLIERYCSNRKPFYVKNTAELASEKKIFNSLNNHKTSNQNESVVKRLEIILSEGGYKEAQKKLAECGLTSKKRHYNVLKPSEQSPTIMTISDDYIHYNSPRSLTVREMARLQSFDDSFVFQGKRSTGGNNRKTEVPQFTLVGNAVPPLLARAVATEILKEIK